MTVTVGQVHMAWICHRRRGIFGESAVEIAETRPGEALWDKAKRTLGWEFPLLLLCIIAADCLLIELKYHYAHCALYSYIYCLLIRLSCIACVYICCTLLFIYDYLHMIMPMHFTDLLLLLALQPLQFCCYLPHTYQVTSISVLEERV